MHASKIAELQMNELWDYVDRGAMKASIDKFHSLDIAPSVLDFVLDRDSYVFPQSEQRWSTGEIVVPEHNIAVVALTNRQRLVYRSQLLHPLQRDSIRAQGTDIKALDSLLDDENPIKHIITSSGKGHGRASTSTGSAVLPVSGARVLTRPTIIYNVNGYTTPESDPSKSMHELVHLAQKLSRAVINQSERPGSEELEPYAVQAASVLGDYRIPYTLSAQLAGKVEGYRVLYIGDKSYAITPDFMHAISAEPQLLEMFS